MPSSRTSKRVRIARGDTAVAPTVDHPQGFAVENSTSHALTVSFRFDPIAHVMTVVIEEPRGARRLPRETGTEAFGPSSPDQPA
jgi:hypothetical protein